MPEFKEPKRQSSPKSPGAKKESSPEINYKEIFDQKLASIKGVSRGKGDVLSGLEGLGIKVVKLAPALIFSPKEFEWPKKEYQLWLEDFNDTGVMYPHAKAEDRLKQFLASKKVELPKETRMILLSSYVIQDDQGSVYLIVDNLLGRVIRTDVSDEESQTKWSDLVSRYALKQVITKIPEGKSVIDLYSSRYGSKPETLISLDLVGQIRENMYLLSFGEKYKMTNSQFMRFRLRAITSREAALNDKDAALNGVSYLINLDDLAKEVVSAPKEEKEEGYL